MRGMHAPGHGHPPGMHAPPWRILPDAVNERAVHILLECILVIQLTSVIKRYLRSTFPSMLFKIN